MSRPLRYNWASSLARLDATTPPLQRTSGPPLADQIYETLCRHIDTGVWNELERLPSERALAEQMGVCRVTVARAVARLAEEGKVRRRRGSGTFVSSRSEPKEKTTTGTVGLLIPFSHDEYAGRILKAVASELSDAGYQLLFHDTRADWRREATQISRLRDRADGFLIFPADPTRTFEAYNELHDAGIPFVLVDRYCYGCSCDYVVTDNFTASLEAVRRLIASGRKRIVHLTTQDLGCSSAIDRRLGFSQALLESGLPVTPMSTRIITTDNQPADYAPEISGAPPLAALPLIRALLREHEPPDAFFALNDWATLACLDALRLEGVRVPEDIAVSGFVDNELAAARLPVRIVAVSQPKDEIGRTAAQILLGRLRGDTAPPHQISLPALVHDVGGQLWSEGPAR